MIKYTTSSIIYKIPLVSDQQLTEETEKKWYFPHFTLATLTSKKGRDSNMLNV